MDFSNVTVLCIGDVMLDRFLHGEVERISPEAPIPVIRVTHTHEMLGGAGNVAHNVAALGGRALLVGLVGDDPAARTLHALSDAIPGIEPHFVRSGVRPSICKSRFIAARQQVVRADEESHLPLQPPEADALARAIDALLPAADVVILSDYGKGVLSPIIVESVVAAAKRHRVGVFVDPKSDDFGRYRGATCITPNMKELRAASKLPAGDDDGIEAAARGVMAQAEAAAILVTRSEHGMMLVPNDGPRVGVPSRAREVFDVSGAGDTVIATLALAHASGLTLEQSMHVANAAAGIVVSKLGTATASVAEVLREIESQEEVADTALPVPAPLDVLEARVAHWRLQGLSVGFTNGCFDIVHPGHIALLQAARAACDRLVVALNTDDSVRRLKGPSRPVNDLDSRARVIAAIRHVDGVVAFDAPTPLALIERLRPDVLVKGADYRVEDVVGADVVEANGGRVLLAELVPGQSTTALVARMRAPAPAPVPAGAPPGADRPW